MPYILKSGILFQPFFTRWLLLVEQMTYPPIYQAELANIILYHYSLAALYLNSRAREKDMALQPVKFVPVRLDADQKETFKSWEVAEGIDVGEMLTNLILDGYKISVSYADKSGSFVASVTCRTDDPPNRGLCITSHHETPYKALMVALFKHFVVLAETPWKEYATGSDWG